MHERKTCVEDAVVRLLAVSVWRCRYGRGVLAAEATD